MAHRKHKRLNRIAKLRIKFITADKNEKKKINNEIPLINEKILKSKEGIEEFTREINKLSGRLYGRRKYREIKELIASEY